ncbi:pyruvate, phosphate dikinase [soil metagenome]
MSMQWVRHFRDGQATERDLLGGKGANLAEMTRIGLPVPPGFTVTTDAFRAVRDHSGEPPAGLWDEIAAALADVEQQLDRQFANPGNPLLLSVRSGARDSMPGMMDTILNIGLNDQSADGLAGLSGERFAWDAYRRLVQMYGRVVLDIDGREFETLLNSSRTSAGVRHDHQLSPSDTRTLVRDFQTVITSNGHAFPGDPWQQLQCAVMAVFQSWDTPRAIAYRRSNGLSDTAGTAVTIQAMVFGNIGSDCASGVAFTRNPNTGEPGMFGEYMVNSQGEDVVSGSRTPESIHSMAGDPALEEAWRDLLAIGDRLEQHYADMQDLEFTIERGRLWMLQTRTAKRTAAAAVRIAVDMEREGLIDRSTAVLRVRPTDLEHLLHPQIDESQPLEAIAQGLPSSPGAAAGRATFSPDDARKLGKAGEAVILVRNETSAEDFPGMERSQGILTARGGMTSHAAVVARGMGLPAVTGCSEIEFDPDAQSFGVNDVVVNDGDAIAIDGSTGRVFLGIPAMTDPGLGAHAELVLEWADQVRRLGVRANADTPEDAERARQFGAEGIGLCRTEHMFFAPGRIEQMRQMILATSDSIRATALDELQVFQTADFAGIFRAMDGCPVTIRLLDPPLHEFLPATEAEQHELAEQLNLDPETVVQMVASLREVNPMLGLRGVRLGMTYPEVTHMQARAIFAAAVVVSEEGINVEPEIMVPLVSTPIELERQRKIIDEVAAGIFAKHGATLPYKVGTMIEVPRAALMAGAIAKHADFFSIGTNDLTQMTFGLSRDDSARFLPDYVESGVLPDDPFQVLDQEGVGRLVQIAIANGRTAKPDISIGVCGEHGGDPRSIAFCHEVGVDYVSCSPFRVPVARLAAARAGLEGQ